MTDIACRTPPAPPRARRLVPSLAFVSLLVLLSITGAATTGLAAPGQSVVTGSVVTGKASRNDVLTYTLVNCHPFPVTINYVIALPPQLSLVGGSPPAGGVGVPAQSYAVVQLVVQVVHGTSPGLQNAPMNWTNATTLESGLAVAGIRTRPFDEFSPTLFSTPNPRLLVLGSGSVTTLAGCIGDSGTVSTRWRLIGSEDPFTFATAVTNPTGGPALMTVSNASGSIPIPAGPPATIIQTITPPFTLDPIVVNEVTVTLDAPAPGGPIPGVAVSRYTVIFVSPGPVPAESRRWSEIKRLHAP